MSRVAKTVEGTEPTGGEAQRNAKGGVNSVEVAGSVLRALSDQPGPARLADLARATGLPSAKVHRYLVSLIRAGLVEQDEDTSRYDLGGLALRAGIVALSRSDTLKRAERVLNSIVEKTGETAAAAVWGSHGPTLVRLVEARHESASSVPLGHVCSLTYSASGLVFCAFGNPDMTSALVERELSQNKASGRRAVPTTRDQLDQILADVRASGLASVGSGGDGGLAAVAVPIFGRNGRLGITLSVFGRPERLDISSDGPISRLMLEAGRNLTADFPASFAAEDQR